MKSIIYTFLLFIGINSVSAQVINEILHSSALGPRQLKIQLPRGYGNKENKNKKYPLCVVLDGDYLFEPVAGNVDFISYWEDMPDAIVVGINHGGSKKSDCETDNSLPSGKGAQFFDFIGLELIPYMENNYSASPNFRVVIGHGETANFINYFLLKPIPLFQAYVVISPRFSEHMNQFLTDKLKGLNDRRRFYYLASGTEDSKYVKASVEKLTEDIMAIGNKKLLFESDVFDDLSYYKTPIRGIPVALNNIFKAFQPISKKEFKEVILSIDTSPVDYLVQKYAAIKELYGIDKTIIINDFKAIEAAIEKHEEFQYFEALGKLAREYHPETVLGGYYIGRFQEETGDPKKAMKTYKSAYILQEAGGITKDMLLELADEIQADFGY